MVCLLYKLRCGCFNILSWTSEIGPMFGLNIETKSQIFRKTLCGDSR
jgi:hypothetical protein